MSVKDFQIISKLGNSFFDGEGAYSTVYKVKRISDKCDYALKRVKLDKLSEKEKQNALNEVRILASCRHPNLIAYKEAFIEDTTNSLCIIMEFADNGDLFQKIAAHQKKGQLFTEEEIWGIFIQMTKALKPLHELKIFHRDLKSANVFLYKDGTVKLGDMNVSKVAKKGLLYTQTGTPYYASPEVWKDQPYDQKSDIWSLGCVLYEMTTLKPPFRAEDMEGLYKKVVRGLYPSIPPHYSQDLNNLIRSLLQVTPQLRPSCDKILSMSSVQKRMSEKHLTEIDESEQNMLLKTIRFPKSLNYLTERLPKANYTPLKTVIVDKQQFLQTLAGHGARPKERVEDHFIRESGSLDSKKKQFDKNSIPGFRAAQKQKISLANSRSQPELIKGPQEKIQSNEDDKIHEAGGTEENDNREPRKKEEDLEQKLLNAKERERREKEKEKERQILVLREKAKQKAAEYQPPPSYLLLSDTKKSYGSNISIQSTTKASDHLSEIRPKEFLQSKNDMLNPSSQSISVAVIKANQFRAGDGLNFIQGKQGKDFDLLLPRKSRDHQLTGIQELHAQKIKNLKGSLDSPRVRIKPEPSLLGAYKRKAPLNPEYFAPLELSSVSPNHRLPAISHDPSKSKLPALAKNSYEITPIAEHSKQKLKNLSKAYSVNLLDPKKGVKRDLPHLSLGVSGKKLETTPTLEIFSNN